MYILLPQKLPNCFLSHCAILHPHQQHENSSCSVSSPTLVLSVFFISIILCSLCILVSAWWYLIMVLIDIDLMTNDIFLCVHWPFACILFQSVSSYLLPIFNQIFVTLFYSIQNFYTFNLNNS